MTQAERALIDYGILLIVLAGFLRWKLSRRLVSALMCVAGAGLLAGDLLYVYA